MFTLFYCNCQNFENLCGRDCRLPIRSDQQKYRNFHSTFPELCKIACVNPIYKSGLKTSEENYQPISILPIISKICERHSFEFNVMVATTSSFTEQPVSIYK